MAKYLIGGASLDGQKRGVSYDYHGYTYYFCSLACRDKFTEAALAGINP